MFTSYSHLWDSYHPSPPTLRSLTLTSVLMHSGSKRVSGYDASHLHPNFARVPYTHKTLSKLTEKKGDTEIIENEVEKV